MDTLTLPLGTYTQRLETTSELYIPTTETTDGVLRIGFITTSTRTQPLQTFTQRATTNLQSIDDGPIVIPIGAGYPSTRSTATSSIDSVTTVPGGSIPHPNPPAPPTDPTANPVVIAGGIAGGLVALILVAVMGAYRIRQDSTDPEVVKVEYFEPKYDPSDSPDSSPPELVDMKAEFGYGAQDLPTPPMEKEGGRKPMAGRIWGTR
ncbi:hypothetical protein BCR33DRAFT_718388 [Rhizoclosmatium globosum]|uniref:Uncharacterized protein n=1 Tax=Rhizoclosmatium globosum TaxID=329046 RepID=A0A1Y2C576_9FUNG|nr:hypothetical protein BCR33DRAFT_718388 [Rhizoclosmatium globosum]|eukprot:ORY42188.1 hypothetical protein BCR33DRAFT_718388 [Rhizoclosmatium globosum]